MEIGHLLSHEPTSSLQEGECIYPQRSRFYSIAVEVMENVALLCWCTVPVLHSGMEIISDDLTSDSKLILMSI